MNLEIKPITPWEADAFFREKNCSMSNEGSEFTFAISVIDGSITRGVIAMCADGKSCSLGHMYTDGTALVGSVLYGCAWRASKALGYREIVI